MKRYEKIAQDTILIASVAIPALSILGMMAFWIGIAFMIFY